MTSPDSPVETAATLEEMVALVDAEIQRADTNVLHADRIIGTYQSHEGGLIAWRAEYNEQSDRARVLRSIRQRLEAGGAAKNPCVHGRIVCLACSPHGPRSWQVRAESAEARLSAAESRVRELTEALHAMGCSATSLVAAASGERLRDSERLDWHSFIGWIGSGYNARGKFPRNLTELNDDCREFVAQHSAKTVFDTLDAARSLGDAAK